MANTELMQRRRYYCPWVFTYKGGQFHRAIRSLEVSLSGRLALQGSSARLPVEQLFGTSFAPGIPERVAYADVRPQDGASSIATTS